jgi:hypothetical protein
VEEKELEEARPVCRMQHKPEAGHGDGDEVAGLSTPTKRTDVTPGTSQWPPSVSGAAALRQLSSFFLISPSPQRSLSSSHVGIYGFCGGLDYRMIDRVLHDHTPIPIALKLCSLRPGDKFMWRGKVDLQDFIIVNTPPGTLALSSPFGATAACSHRSVRSFRLPLRLVTFLYDFKQRHFPLACH